MPSYEYECDGCGHVFEEFMSISDRDVPTKQKCPECSKKKIRRGMNSFPTIGYDQCLKPQRGFKNIIEKIKNNGQVPKRYHDRLDQSTEMRGGNLGKKSTG